VAAAYGWDFDDMVAVAHDGIDATWLDDGSKAALRRLTDDRAEELRSRLAD
jgi:adenosine deaminase